ncbi:MAG: NAD(P)-binding domain-containing protein [Candidatus Paceibacterota bacterium]
MTDNGSVLIFGGGEMGKGLAHLVAAHEPALQVRVFDVDTRRSTCTAEELPAVISESRIIFIAVPSHMLEEAVSAVNEYRSTDQSVIALTKGMTRETDRFTGEVLREELGENVAVLVGPMLAEEVLHELPAYGLCAGSKDAFQQVRSVTTVEQLRLEYSADIMGASVCGLLKNIYSIGFGIADGLSLGNNFRGLLLTTAIAEMMSVVERFEGERATVLSAAGVGDLVATASSMYSSNYAVGRELARNGSTDRQSEGRCSLRAFARRLSEDSTLVLYSSIKRVVLGEQSVDHFRDQLMRTVHV